MSGSSAENIARVVRDIFNGSWTTPYVFDGEEGFGRDRHEAIMELKDQHDWRAAISRAVTIDATALYDDWDETRDDRDLYADHPCIAPPWRDAIVAYENSFGNIMVMMLSAADSEAGDKLERWDDGEDSRHCDWSRVRWVISASVMMGGRSLGKPIPTSGPWHIFRVAIYEDGSPALISWVQLTSIELERWQFPLVIFLGALNLANCSNIEIREPKRQRHEQKRVQRTGVTVSEIHIKGTSIRSLRSSDKGGIVDPMRLHTVRGHMAHYGDCCPGQHEPNGKLFGRITGRFFVPQHARGSEDVGVVQQSYVVGA